MDIFLWAIKISRILYYKMQLLPTLFRVAENMTEKPIISLTDACTHENIKYEQCVQVGKIHIVLLFIFLLTCFVAKLQSNNHSYRLAYSHRQNESYFVRHFFENSLRVKMQNALVTQLVSIMHGENHRFTLRLVG